MSSSHSNIPLFHITHLADSGIPLDVGTIDPEEVMNGGFIPDRHTFHAIFWITEGSGFHHIDFNRYEIKSNSLFMMRAGQIHYFEVDQPFAGHRIFFNDEFIPADLHSRIADFLYLTTDASPVLYLNEADIVALNPLMKQIYSEWENRRSDFYQALQHLIQLYLIQIRRFYRRIEIEKPTPKTQIASNFQRMVDANYTSIHRVGDYADLLGVTADYLSDQVKEVIGLSASALIRNRLIVESKRLLVHTDQTMGEIGSGIGFKDSSYFGRFFKRETQLTPIRFRKSFPTGGRNRLANRLLIDTFSHYDSPNLSVHSGLYISSVLQKDEWPRFF